MLYNRKSLNYVVHRLLHYPFDGSREDPCPVEHTYTQREIQEMFKKFRSCAIEVDYLFGTGYGRVNDLIPRRLHQYLGKWMGWHLMIKANR